MAVGRERRAMQAALCLNADIMLAAVVVFNWSLRYRDVGRTCGQSFGTRVMLSRNRALTLAYRLLGAWWQSRPIIIRQLRRFR